MVRFRFPQIVSSCALLLAVACGSDPAVQAPDLGGSDDKATEDEADGDATDGTGDKPTGSLDGGVKSTAKPDASASIDAKVPSSSADAGSKSGDGGGTKVDATVSSVDGGGPAPTTPTLKPKCMKKDSQLIVIGDSYINWISHTFPDDIVKESGQKWRMEAIGGTSMGSGGIGPIPDQFYNSIKADPDAHTVLMDGGGNDVLVADPTIDLFHECQEPGSSKKENCQKIVRLAIEAADKLTLDAAAKGIRDVVYFFYPHVPANTILSGSMPDEILDYALPMVRSFCEGREAKTSGKLRCHFVDLVPLFEGHKDWFNEDIHPNSKGSQAMAKHLWQFMKDRCIGQKTGAGRCEE
jgi:lysophospholipase L1-like esterase